MFKVERVFKLLICKLSVGLMFEDSLFYFADNFLAREGEKFVLWFANRIAYTVLHRLFSVTVRTKLSVIVVKLTG